MKSFNREPGFKHRAPLGEPYHSSDRLSNGFGKWGLGENCTLKELNHFVTQTCKCVFKKTQDVSDSLLPGEMNADKPILTVNLFCCLNSSDTRSVAFIFLHNV